MTWVAFLFAVELGVANLANAKLVEYVPGQTIYANPKTSLGQTVYVELEAGVVLAEILEIGGASQTYMSAVSLTSYAPWHADYWFWAKAHYRGLSVGLRHICQHPGLTPVRPEVGYLFGGGNVMFVRYETPRVGRER